MSGNHTKSKHQAQLQSLGFFLSPPLHFYGYTLPQFPQPLLGKLFYPISHFSFTIYSPYSVPECPILGGQDRILGELAQRKTPCK